MGVIGCGCVCFFVLSLLACLPVLCSDANRGFDLASPRISYLPRGTYPSGTPSMHAASAGHVRGKREGLTECSDFNSGMIAIGAECTSEGLAYRCMGESQAGGMPGLQRRGPHDCLPHSLAAVCRTPATALCLPHLTPAAGPSLVLYPVIHALFREGARMLKLHEAGRLGRVWVCRRFLYSRV